MNDMMSLVPGAGYGKLVQLAGTPLGQVCTLPDGSEVCVVSCPHMGIGFIAHVLPAGVVPSVMKVPVIFSS